MLHSDSPLLPTGERWTPCQSRCDGARTQRARRDFSRFLPERNATLAALVHHTSRITITSQVQARARLDQVVAIAPSPRTSTTCRASPAAGLLHLIASHPVGCRASSRDVTAAPSPSPSRRKKSASLARGKASNPDRRCTTGASSSAGHRSWRPAMGLGISGARASHWRTRGR